MPVDKFGKMSDAKSRDTGMSLTYVNNNYIRKDGSTPVTGSINMNGYTLYNMSNPVNLQDVATKEYAIKRDLDMNNKRLKNIPPPVEDTDAVNTIYVDTSSNETKRYVNSVTPFVNRQNEYVATNNINMREFTLQNVG